jgi:hypothetical protein
MPHKDKGAYKAYKKKDYIKNMNEYKWRNIKNSYNLSREEYFALIEKQDNKCALCLKPFEGILNRKLHIDHCHATNKVRGLLCMPCNVGLGMLGDDEEGLTKALAYVKGELA